MAQRIKVHIEAGKMQLYDKVLWAEILAQYDGDDVMVELKKLRRTRSNEQNRYYWAVIIGILSDHFGYNKTMKSERELLHTALCQEFLGIDIAGLSSHRTSSDLNTAEFEWYCRQIREWASMEYGVYIPKPNEVVLTDDFSFMMI